jgi:hypothetical protein
VPNNIVKTRGNSEYLDVGPLENVTMYLWKDESWSIEQLSAGYRVNNRERAIPFVLFPVDKGKYSVFIQCEGFKAVKAKGGTNDGKMSGFLCDNANLAGWRAYAYSGCTISNYRTSDSNVPGHPDMKVNGGSFTDQLVERDFSCSFHLEVPQQGYFGLEAPPIEKSDHFNFVVSCANFTDKILEWGSISVAIDEVNDGAYSRSKWDKTTAMSARLPTQVSAPSEVYTPEAPEQPTNEGTESMPPAPNPALGPDNPATKEPTPKIVDNPDPKVLNWLNNQRDKPVVEEVLRESPIYAPPPPPSLVPTHADTLRQADKVRRALMANASRSASPPPTNTEVPVLGATDTASLSGSLRGGSLRGNLGSRPSLPRVADSPPRSVSPARSETSTLQGGSLSGGSLRGGNLQALPEATREQRREYERLKNTQGKTVAKAHAKEHGYKPPKSSSSLFG